MSPVMVKLLASDPLKASLTWQKADVQIALI